MCQRWRKRFAPGVRDSRRSLRERPKRGCTTVVGETSGTPHRSSPSREKPEPRGVPFVLATSCDSTRIHRSRSETTTILRRSTQQEIRKAVAQRIRDGLDSGRKRWRPWFKWALRSAAYTQQPSARFASREEAVRACKQVVSATAATSDSCSSQTHLKHTSKVSRGANHRQEIMNSRKSNRSPGSGVFSGS